VTSSPKKKKQLHQRVLTSMSVENTTLIHTDVQSEQPVLQLSEPAAVETKPMAVENTDVIWAGAESLELPGPYVQPDNSDDSIKHEVCQYPGCSDSVFLACPVCLHFLCYDHKDTLCSEHQLLSLNIDCSDDVVFGIGKECYVIIVDDESGKELRVPVQQMASVSINTLKIRAARNNGSVRSLWERIAKPFVDQSSCCFETM